MSCVVRWWDVLFVKGMHFSSKNARLLNLVVVTKINLLQHGNVVQAQIEHWVRHHHVGGDFRRQSMIRKSLPIAKPVVCIVARNSGYFRHYLRGLTLINFRRTLVLYSHGLEGDNSSDGSCPTAAGTRIAKTAA